MWKKCAQSHRFGLGRVGGIPLGRGGGGGVGEPRTGIIPLLFRVTGNWALEYHTLILFA